MAYDFTTPTGQVRLLIADVDEGNQVLDDNMLTGLFLLRGADPTGPVDAVTIKRTAADALETIATSEVLVGKKIRSADGTTTDGAAVAAELRNLAASLRAQADLDVEAADGGGFDVVEYRPYGC